MAYILPPEPADDVVIVPARDDQPAFTWGDHRQILAMLEELEAESETVRVARQKLDYRLEEAGFTVNFQPVLICQYCHRKEDEPHEVECPDHNDPALWVKREAAAYQYLSDKFEVVHATSVPMTDDEALEYFGIVQLMFPNDPDLWVRFIKRKAVDSTEYQLMPWQFNKDVWEVFPVG